MKIALTSLIGVPVSLAVILVRSCYYLIFRTFEDGFPNLFISNAQGIRGQHVAFLASFSSPSVIFEQLSVIYALPKLFVSSFTLVLPFFPTGTSERMEDEGDVATAFTLARILSNIPNSRGGPTSLVTFDIHALQVCSSSHSPLCPFYLIQTDLYLLPAYVRKDFTLVTIYCHTLRVEFLCSKGGCKNCLIPTMYGAMVYPGR